MDKNFWMTPEALERRYALLQAAAIMRSRRDFSAKQAVEEAREMLAMLEAEAPKKP